MTLSNLDALNAYGDSGQNVYLHSNEGIATYQTTPWFRGVRPAPDGSTPGATASTIIMVPKADNVLDAFYFSFYAFVRRSYSKTQSASLNPYLVVPGM